MDFIFNEKIEKMSRKKIRELQLKRLKETVHRVFDNVPFYQKKFKELKITPGDIKTLDDIRKLPFTTKNDLRDNEKNMREFNPAFSCTEAVSYSWWHKHEDLRLYRNKVKGKRVILPDYFLNTGWKIKWVSKSVTLDSAKKYKLHEEGMYMLEEYFSVFK